MMMDTSRRPVGILALDTTFERIPGDVGNTQTWDFPVVYRIVRGADPLRVIDGEAEGLLDAFIEAGQQLVDQGCVAIATTCGFLSLYQEQLSAALSVPVATSSLLQIPLVERLMPRGQTVGVITMDAARLTPRHMKAVGVDCDVTLEGLSRNGVFWRMVTQDTKADPIALRDEVIEAGARLLARQPNIGSIVLECTNMPPFSAALAKASGLPVFDVVSLVKWLAGAIAPHDFASAG